MNQAENTEKYIQLAHGSGGKLSHDLIKNVIVQQFKNPILDILHDGAKINVNGGELAFATDSYVINPRFFPGGDVGKLAVCGTVNDLAMTGARPLYLSAAFILEDGFCFDEFQQIVRSMAETAALSGVKIVTGDTKVVEKGAIDGLFINTAGIGQIISGVNIDVSRVKPGQKIILSGYLGDHAVAVMGKRHGLNLPQSLLSDCAPLNSLVEIILKTDPRTVMLRDPTRGGLATTLNEIASQAEVGIMIYEEKIPIRKEITAVCDILGFDPLYLANEGKLIAIVETDASREVLAAMLRHPLGQDAKIIGETVQNPAGQVGLITNIGGVRLLDMLTGEQLPRIC